MNLKEKELFVIEYLKNNQFTISIEGGEGAGKSSLMDKIKKLCQEHNLDAYYTREPGGTTIGESIREIIVSRDNKHMCYETECLLYAATRAQLLHEKVRPMIEAKKFVVYDRYVDSSYVYQGYVRGLGLDKVVAINNFATNEFLPNLTFYLDIEPEIGLKRIYDANRITNRFEDEKIDFHLKLRKYFNELVILYPNRIYKLNAEKSQDEVYEDFIDTFYQKIKGFYE